MNSRQLLFIIFLLGFLSAHPKISLAERKDSIDNESTCFIDGLESYLSRPKILSITPHSYPNLNSRWEETRQSHLEMVAQIVHMYPKYQIYFLARDSELLYDTAILMTQGDPQAQSRLHLLNVSRTNMNSRNLRDYLAQEGITEDKLKNGQKVLFVDTGFLGSIPDKIRALFPRRLASQLQTHLIISETPRHPSTRVFLSKLNEDAAREDPSGFHDTIIDYEEMPRYSDRSTGFRYSGSQIHPVSPVGSQVDGSVSKPEAKKYMQDLAAFCQTDEAVNRFKEIGAVWRELYNLAASGQKNILIEKLTELAISNDAFSEAIVRDFIEILQLNHPHHLSADKDLPAQSYTAVNKQTNRRLRVEFTKQEVDQINTGIFSVETDEKLKTLARINFSPEKKSTAREKTVLLIDLDEAFLKKVSADYDVQSLVQKIRKEDVRILAVSDNTEEQTKAIIQQLKLEGKTLAQWNVEFVPKAIYQTPGGEKSVLKLRKKLNINSKTKITVLSDSPTQYHGLSEADRVTTFHNWEINTKDDNLKPEKANDTLTKQQGPFFDKSEDQRSQNLYLAARKRHPNILSSDSLQIEAIYTRGPPVKVSLEEVALKEVGLSEEDLKLKLAKKYPEWKTLIRDPQSKIPELLRTQEYGKIGALTDVYFDSLFYTILFESLSKMNLANPNAKLLQFLKDISIILGNHFSTPEKQLFKLVELKAPRPVILFFLKQNNNLSTLLRSSHPKTQRIIRHILFVARNSQEELLGFSLIASLPSQYWEIYALKYLEHTTSERVLRDLFAALSSNNHALQKFALVVLSQSEGKKKNANLAAFQSILKKQRKSKKSFQEVFEEQLQKNDLSIKEKMILLFSQMGVQDSKFEEYLALVPADQKDLIWQEINAQTSIPVFQKLAKKLGQESLLYNNGKLESFRYVTIISQEQAKAGGVKFLMGHPGQQNEVILTKAFDMAIVPFSQLKAVLATEDNQSHFKDRGIEVTLKGQKVKLDPSLPAEQYSWEDEQIILDLLNKNDPHWHYRRPTEAEWEYAARANTQTRYSFGDNKQDIPTYAWNNRSSNNQSQPIGTLQENAFGLHDMHGNVSEWVKDSYDVYPPGPLIDPAGPEKGPERVVRGGSWFDYDHQLQSAHRYYWRQDISSYTVGFRFVRSPK